MHSWMATSILSSSGQPGAIAMLNPHATITLGNLLQMNRDWSHVKEANRTQIAANAPQIAIDQVEIRDDLSKSGSSASYFGL
jgi:hypothetical protein